MDRDLMFSVFHPDARDCSGRHSTGSPAEFVEAYIGRQGTVESCMHYITNISLEIDGDVAHGETYFFAVYRRRDSSQVEQTGGRYIDQLERRNGEWKISLRVVVHEWCAAVDGSEWGSRFGSMIHGSRDRRDPSYERPLMPRAGAVS
jgi:SnoaL-like protein